MPRNKDDISFGFDLRPFQNAMEQIDKKLGNLKTGAINMAKAVGTGMMTVVKKLFVLAGSIKGIQGLFRQIPEIGKAFGIAKDVIMKNFLYPLRQAVFPLLQRMLNWVRDNRKTFVIWGENLANVFRVVTSSIQGVFKIARALEGVFLGFINRVFGMQVKNFQELLNLLTFKMAVTVEFLKSIMPDVIKGLKPFLDIFAIGLKGAFETISAFMSGFLGGLSGIEKPIKGILNSIKQIVTNLFTVNEQGNSIQTVFKSIGNLFGEIIKWVAEMTDSFLKGFMPAIKNIATPLQRIVDAFSRIFESIFGSDKALTGWKSLFKTLGTIAGDTIVKAFEGIAWIVEFVEKGLKAWKDIIEFIKGGGKVGEPLEVKKVPGLGPVPEFLQKYYKVKDVIITKRGDVVQTDPEDNILAFKNIPKGGGNIEIGNIDLSGMQLNFNEATPAVGQEVARTIVDTLRDALNKELITSGAA